MIGCLLLSLYALVAARILFYKVEAIARLHEQATDIVKDA